MKTTQYVNMCNIKQLGSLIPTTCGSTFSNDPPDAVIYAAIDYIQNLKQEIHDLQKSHAQLKQDHDHVANLHSQALADMVSYRQELRAVQLVLDLSEKYPPGMYDESEGVQYLKELVCR